MTGKQVWYPGTSRAARAMEQEKGRGSYTQQASSKPRVAEGSRRRTSERKPAAADQQTQGTSSGYSTVERGRNSSILDYSSPSNDGQSSQLEFSGWQDREELLPSSSRRAVHTPAPGLRLTSTRLGTRGSQRRRDYEFQHFLEAHAHMDHYRTHYCYTTLSTAPTEGGRAVPELVEQNKQALLTVEVKSLYRGDPFLRELASRLGVGELIREPQLLSPTRHTPPSIVKKHKTQTDLAIDLASKTRCDEGEDDGCSPAPAWAVDSTKTIRHSPLELPRIPEASSVPHKDKTSSTISINKYLRVSSAGDEGSESSHTLPHVPTPHTLLSSASSQTEVTESTPAERPSDHTHLKSDKPPPLIQTDKPLVHTLDKAQRERLISQTAHSLGLSSREWAAPPTNKQMNKYLNYVSRPATRQAENDRPSTRQTKQGRPLPRQAEKGRPSTRQVRRTEQRGTSGRQHERVGSPTKQTHPSTRQHDKVTAPISQRESVTTPTRERSSTRQEKRRSREGSLKPHPQSTLRHREKLNRLESIYKSQRSNSPTHTRTHTRPPTHTHTRPPTRSHTRTKMRDTLKLEALDGSSYWNELPSQRLKEGAADKREVKRSNEGFSPVGLAIELSQPSPQINRQLLASALKHTRNRKSKLQSNEELQAGASPREITAHLSRLKRSLMEY